MAAVKITCTFWHPTGGADWLAQCDRSCNNPLNFGTPDWTSAYETAIGHALMQHPRGVR